MKRIFLFLFFAALAVSAGAQLSSRDLIPYHKGKKWGFCDASKQMIIGAKFDAARPFSGGWAAVKKKSLWGAIDSTGKTVLPFRYEELGSFKEGFATAGMNGMLGLIDKSGSFIIPANYDKIKVFEKDFFLARDTAGRFFLYDKAGKMLCQALDMDEEVFSNRLIVFEREVEMKLTKADADSLLAELVPGSDDRDIADVKKGFIRKKLTGVYDLKKRKEVLPPQYEEVEIGITNVGLSEEKRKELEKLDDEGKDFIEGNEQLFYFFTEGPRGNGIYSLSKGEIIPAQYERLDDDAWFEAGRAIAQDRTGWFILDLNGKKLNKVPYDKIEGDPEDEAWLTYQLAGRKGIIDRDGNIITPAIFSDVDIAGKRARAYFESTVTLITRPVTGMDSTAYALFDNISGDYEMKRYGRAKAERKKKKGVIDSTGAIVLEPTYEKVFIYDNCIIAAEGKKNMVFDGKGRALPLKSASQLICPADKENKSFIVFRAEGLGIETDGKFKLISRLPTKAAVECYEQYASNNGLCSWIDVNGNVGLVRSDKGKAEIVLPFRYSLVDQMGDRVLVQDTASGLMGIVTLTGTRIVPVKYKICEDARSLGADPLNDFIVCGDGDSALVFNGAGEVICRIAAKDPHADMVADYPTIACGMVVGDWKLVYDKATKKMYPWALSNYEAQETNEVLLLEDTTHHWAVADRNWKLKTGFAYNSIMADGYFDGDNGQGIFIYSVGKLYGIMNDDGKELTPPLYDAIDASEIDNCLVVVKDNKTGLVNFKGKEIVPPAYTSGYEVYYSDILMVKDDNGYCVLYDNEGNCLLKPGILKEVTLLGRGKMSGKNMIHVMTTEGGEEVEFYMDAEGTKYYER